jgi:peptidoglycan/LPS O-acetylase OafA/YrhL
VKSVDRCYEQILQSQKWENAMTNANTRLFGLVAGWILAFYGVQRRNWTGTIIAMAGVSLAEAAIAIGDEQL